MYMHIYCTSMYVVYIYMLTYHIYNYICVYVHIYISVGVVEKGLMWASLHTWSVRDWIVLDELYQR